LPSESCGGAAEFSGLAVGRGIGVELRGSGEVGSDWGLVEIRADGLEVAQIADGVGREAGLPKGIFGGDAVGEAVLDQRDSLVQWISLRGKEQVDMVRHHQKRVQLEVAPSAVVQQGVDEDLGDAGDLEDGAALVGGDGDKEHAVLGDGGGDRAGSGGAGSVRHGAIVESDEGAGNPTNGVVGKLLLGPSRAVRNLRIPLLGHRGRWACRLLLARHHIATPISRILPSRQTEESALWA
jgi:hypothetical protein